MGLCGTKGRGHGEDFKAKYVLGRQLGSGSYAVVYECTRKRDAARFAVKVIQKKKLTEDDMNALVEEVKILRKLKHDNIIRFEDFVDDGGEYYLVTELIRGGELFDEIVRKEFYSEKEAQDIVRTLVETVGFCHEQNVVHRDLKPENILLTESGPKGTIKLADFGFARALAEGDVMKTACGTPGYVAPEILSSDPMYTHKVDMWAVGVIVYILLCGRPPFYEENTAQLFRKIRAAKYEFHPDEWKGISEQAKDFVRKLLQVNPGQRMSATAALKHPWMQATANTANMVATLENLKQFNARRKWKAGITAVRAGVRIQRLREAIQEAVAEDEPKPIV